jgi:hypothetical protein
MASIGAASSVVVGRTPQIALLVLHILLSIFAVLATWGISNNFIQRLNFARWVGTQHWPDVSRLGGPEYAWRGVPAKAANPTVQQPRDWMKARWDRAGRASKGWLWITWFVVPSLRYNLRYRAPEWPSLRFLRFFAAVPWQVPHDFISGKGKMCFPLARPQGRASAGTSSSVTLSRQRVCIRLISQMGEACP